MTQCSALTDGCCFLWRMPWLAAVRWKISSLTYYSHIGRTKRWDREHPARAGSSQTIFMTSPTKKAAEPAKEDASCFLQRNPRQKFASTMQAVPLPMWGPCGQLPSCAGAFPKGYNAFALIYRPGAQTCEGIWQEPSASSLTMRTNWSGHRLLLPTGRLGRSANSGVAGVLQCEALAVIYFTSGAVIMCSTRG